MNPDMAMFQKLLKYFPKILAGNCGFGWFYFDSLLPFSIPLLFPFFSLEDTDFANNSGAFLKYWGAIGGDKELHPILKGIFVMK